MPVPEENAGRMTRKYRFPELLCGRQIWYLCQQQNQEDWHDPACRANLAQCTFAAAAWRPGDRDMVVM
jgi:hypothetical protein